MLCLVNAVPKRKFIVASLCLFLGLRKTSCSFFCIRPSNNVVVKAVYRLPLVSGRFIFGSVQANGVMWAA